MVSDSESCEAWVVSGEASIESVQRVGSWSELELSSGSDVVQMNLKYLLKSFNHLQSICSHLIGKQQEGILTHLIYPDLLCLMEEMVGF